MPSALSAAARRGLPYIAAVTVWTFAWSTPVSLPMPFGVAVLVAAILTRRPALVLVGLAVGVSVFAANARSGLVPPLTGPWSGVVTLVSDPVERGGGAAVDVSSGLGRFEVVAWGPAGRVVLEHESGDRLAVDGRLSPLPSPSRVVARHLRARLSITSARVALAPVWWMGPANLLRARVLAGARWLPLEQRPIYAGFVLGDDRGRSEQLTREFESSGLSHLLVVSGENVVFVLVVLSPVLVRVGRRSRVAITIVVLLLFAGATRFEPSVLRATFMAAVATLALSTGRSTSGRRTLAITVVVLLLIDPLLVHSMGFVLSVAASAGIVVIGPVIERRLRGPHRLRALLAVTVAAQVAVAPIVIPLFGPMPLVAIPANVAAEPIAGLVMMWGCTGGVLAGLTGGPIGTVVQLPARVGLTWVIGVAGIASGLPRLDVGLVTLAVVVAFVCVVVLVGRARGRRRLATPERSWTGR